MEETHHCGIDDLDRLAVHIISQGGNARIFALFGPLGAGKTTLITRFAKALGSTDRVQSPTFGLVNEYLAANGHPFYHFDFYRVESPEEAFDMGYETYFYSGEYCFVEWPEKIGDLIPVDAVRIHIHFPEGSDETGKKRKIMVEYPD